jgi:cyclic pyranopterin monophosphate synthase
MRDVSNKTNTLRTARATASLHCLPETLAAIKAGKTPKADPIGVAKVAGIQGAKNTSVLIPYCHQIPLDFVGVEAELKEGAVHIFSEVKAVWKTGVEMEALVAASVTALTLFDMLKGIDGTMEIGEIRVLDKKGGKSDFTRSDLSNMRAAVLVMSDMGAKGEREDRSGKAIKERLESWGLAIVEYKIIPDDAETIERELVRLCDDASLDVILTTGGTGVGPRDVTPEATSRIVERSLPGVSEFLRAHGQERTRFAMLSRAIAGVRGKTLIINLPGSLSGVNDSLDVLFPWVFHSFRVMNGWEH